MRLRNPWGLTQQSCFNTNFWRQAGTGVTDGQSYTLRISCTNAGGLSTLKADDVTLS